MDFDFITQLYYGNINPNVRDMPRDSALGKASKAFSNAEDLDRGGEESASEPADAHSEIVGTEVFDPTLPLK